MIPFIDLSMQQQRIRNQIETRIRNVLDHGKYIMGPEVMELEQSLSAYIRAKHCISCSSGTDALLLALMAYDIGPGDAILTTPFTFIATAEVISLLGATPVFIDIEPDSFNISPEGIEKALKGLCTRDSAIYPLPSPAVKNGIQAKGIIAVDLFGLPADYDQIFAIAKQYDLFVIEDAAQSFGSEYKGKRSGALGNVGCISFFPAKPLGGYGDGGMCITDDDKIADKIRSLRIHGKGDHKYDNVRIGINGRLDTLQAAILLEKFAIFKDELQLRQKAASRYMELLSGLPHIAIPKVPVEKISAWAQYSIVANNRDTRSAIIDALKNKGIPTAIYYPKPLHLQSAFRYLQYKPNDFVVSEQLALTISSLPFYPYIEPEVQIKIAETIKTVIR